MVIPPIRGRLLDGSDAPAKGELARQLVQFGGVVIEQIVSSQLDGAVDYDQDHDEWVVLLAGAAELEVHGERLSLEPGDWLLLPRGTPHRLVRTTQGASWLAVRLTGG